MVDVDCEIFQANDLKTTFGNDHKFLEIVKNELH